jgi:voltage-gated potassium channel Kch
VQDGNEQLREQPTAATDAGTRHRHVIIVGFGLSGRSSANAIEERSNVSLAVIETNPETVTRCTKGGLNIILGDARKEEVLRRAGIDRATDVAVTVPSDAITLEVVEAVRKLNPTAKIIARVTFVSGGLAATQRGADDVVIAEQVVATEFGRVMASVIGS